MDNLSLKLLSKLNKDNHFSNTELKEINYSIMVFVGDSSKFILLWIIFELLGFGEIYLYAFISTTLIRIFIGGLHFSRYLNCLCFSGVYYIALIKTNEFLSRNMIFVLLSISLLVIMLLAPQLPINSNRLYKLQSKTVKLIALLFIIVYSILYIINKDPLFSIGPLTTIFQSIQLLIMKGEKIYVKYKENIIYP